MQSWMIVFRLLHILAGVLWVGGLVLMSAFIMPALSSSGAAGGQVMQNLVQGTKLTKYLPAMGGIAVLAGFALFYLNMSVAPTWASSRSGMTYSIGGLCGLVALVVGSIMTARSAGTIGKMGAAIAASGAPPTAEQTARIAVLRARMKTGAQIAMTLALVAVIAMAVARYV
ncbi:MAG: hypothetical protein JWM41_4813 [Gemmatimonadetes bacterium]|nr:hypothetical protein [Gemmatimonadota bacterium]